MKQIRYNCVFIQFTSMITLEVICNLTTAPTGGYNMFKCPCACITNTLCCTHANLFNHNAREQIVLVHEYSYKDIVALLTN